MSDNTSDMVMYAEVSVRVGLADRSASLNCQVKKDLNAFVDFFYSNFFAAPRYGIVHQEGEISFTTYLIGSEDEFVGACAQFIRDHDNLMIEADFNYEFGENDCIIIITKDGVFKQTDLRYKPKKIMEVKKDG